MKVTEKDVAYVAGLGNLELTAEESTRMVRDLNSILGYIDTLNELDTANISPMAQVSDKYGVDASKQGSERFAYARREDVLEGLRKSLPHEVALANAPESDGTFFKVPKVIER
jgi:aspartyl-tRNA(Asn)/glutamyl-tRNA(Gln) amidotransferase subunit C